MKEGFSGPRHPQIESPEEGNAAVDEVNVYSILVRATEMIYDRSPEWKERDPKQVIDEMVGRLPSKPRILSRSEAEYELSQPRSPRDDGHGEVSELEAYLLTKTLLQKSKSFYFSGTNNATGTADSFAPAESIRCIRDSARTKKFMSAVREAVTEASNRQETIEVCDAGSGAMPVMGLYAALSSPKVRVTCLENNPHAAQLATAAIEAFGLSDRVKVLRRNALSYVPQRKIDVLVSETMDTGLLHEPLCAILNHLQPHTNKGATILPSSVETFAAAVPVSQIEEAQEFVQLVGKYIARVDVAWIKTGMFVPGLDVREIGATLPLPKTDGSIATLVTSKVNLGANALDIYDCVISMPQSVQQRREGHFERKTIESGRGKSLKIAYAPGTDMQDIFLRTF